MELKEILRRMAEKHKLLDNDIALVMYADESGFITDNPTTPYHIDENGHFHFLYEFNTVEQLIKHLQEK